MKNQTSFRMIALAVASCVIGLPTIRAGDDAGFAEVIPVLVVADGQLATPPSPAVVAIQQATTPSIAIQAYADAKAANPNDLLAEQAYVRRMAELGLPEMAESQARDLNKRMPDNGIAWAVSGYVDAKRDKVDDAVTEMSTAVRLLPGDPFVMRTAGQIVAWYDSTADRLSSPPATRAAVDSMRSSLVSQQAFASAYTEATNAYRAASVPATQPSVAPAEANVVPPVYVAPSGTAYEPSPVYTAPAYYDGYYGGYYGGAYPYWWPGPWQPWCGWWGGFGGVVIFNGHFHHHDGDHDHGFDHHFAPFAPHNGFHGAVAGSFGSASNSVGFTHGGFSEHLPAGFVPGGSGRTTFSPQHMGGGPVVMPGSPAMHGGWSGPAAMPASGRMSGSMGHDFGGGSMGGGGFHGGGGGMHGGGGFSGGGFGGGGMGGGGHR